MRIVTGITAVMASLSLAACDQPPADRATGDRTDLSPIPGEAMPPEPAAASLSGQEFGDTLAASDAFEIAASRLATDRAPTPTVKAFAQKMVDAHTASTDRLKKDGATLTPAIKPDPALSAEQQQKLDALKPLTGTAFEQAYLKEQVAAHEAALGVVQAYAASGSDPVLKRFAAEAIKMVSEHLEEARRLATTAAGATAP